MAVGALQPITHMGGELSNLLEPLQGASDSGVPGKVVHGVERCARAGCPAMKRKVRGRAHAGEGEAELHQGTLQCVLRLLRARPFVAVPVPHVDVDDLQGVGEINVGLGLDDENPGVIEVEALPTAIVDAEGTG